MSSDGPITYETLALLGDLPPRLSPETLEAARQLRATDAHQRGHGGPDHVATDPRPLPESGYTLWAEVVAATIQGDHITVALRLHGQVQRPEGLATATGAVLNLSVPAKVERRTR